MSSVIILIGIMNFAVIIWVIFWNCLLLNTFIRKSFFITVITTISFSCSFSLGHSLYQVLGRVEHSICLLATLITPLTLPVVSVAASLLAILSIKSLAGLNIPFVCLPHS